MSKPCSMMLFGLISMTLTACSVQPVGPTVMILPGSGQSIERFRADELYCRRDAQMMIGGKMAGEAARESALTSAAAGAAVGALAGVAIGGNGQGAAVGAGAGLLMGSAMGADAAQGSSYGTQRQYDNAYIQCMYAKGHRVPVPANMSYARTPVKAAEAGIPPPPAGAPPPPPPGVR